MRTIGGFLLSLTSLLVLTLFGCVYTPLVVLSLLPLGIGLGSALTTLVHTKDWLRLGLLLALLLIAMINLWDKTPSIFTGRDQGSIAEAAWRLTEEHQLSWSSSASQAFFDIYGPGTALNFPGFAYTETGSLITQFPLGYIAWLSGFVGWLGLSGYGVANGLLFIFSGWTFFELASLFVRRTLAIIGVILLNTSFLSLWMLHYTLSEQLALTLFLLLAVSLIHLRRQPTAIVWYTYVLLTATLFLFTRIEGFALFFITSLVIFLIRPLRQKIFSRPFPHLILPGLFFGFLFLRDFFINLPFYTMIGKAALKSWQGLWLLGTANTLSPTPNLWLILSKYGLISLFVIGAIGIGLAFWKEHREALLFLILALPTFIYFIDPNISPDHPWILRRFAFTLWPTFVFFTIFTWHLLETHSLRFRQANITFALAFILIALQYPATRVAWLMDEQSTLFRETATLADRFSGNDLILVDRLSSGDPFRLIAGPLSFLFEKQAVYFFNPEDLNRIKTQAFKRIFLIVPQDKVLATEKKWGNRLTQVQALTFHTTTATVLPSDIFPHLINEKTGVVLFELK